MYGRNFPSSGLFTSPSKHIGEQLVSRILARNFDGFFFFESTEDFSGTPVRALFGLN